MLNFATHKRMVAELVQHAGDCSAQRTHPSQRFVQPFCSYESIILIKYERNFGMEGTLSIAIVPKHCYPIPFITFIISNTKHQYNTILFFMTRGIAHAAMPARV